jgi:hypothetical protein
MDNTKYYVVRLSFSDKCYMDDDNCDLMTSFLDSTVLDEFDHYTCSPKNGCLDWWICYKNVPHSFVIVAVEELKMLGLPCHVAVMTYENEPKFKYTSFYGSIFTDESDDETDDE